MKKANPKTVGGFVIGAVLLAIAAVGVFGSGRFFEERGTIVAFFEGSLMGLRVGAPVELRGVQIGTVTDFWAQVDPDTLEFTFPVLMEIEQSKIRGIAEAAEERERLPQLIDDGLRAQLVTQSLVTGQQSIQMQFLPDTEIRMVETDLPYPQMPTVPSQFEEIADDVGEVIKRANVLLDRVNDILSEENRAQIGEIIATVATTTTELQQGVASINQILVDARAILANVQDSNPKVQKLLDTSEATLRSYQALADRSTALVEENRKGMKDFTATGLYELTNLAVDAQGAIEQFRRVMEEMERDPARFFLGKPGEVEVQ